MIRIRERIAFDPGEPAGGSGPAPAPAHADFGKPPAGASQAQPAAPASPPPGAAVSLPREEVERLYGLASSFQQFQAQQAAEAERLRNEALVAQAKKGEVDQAFETFRVESDKKYQAVEQQLLSGATDTAVSRGLASKPGFRPECAEMVRHLASQGIVAVRGPDGAVRVQEAATGRPAADVIAERLASPGFAVFYPPATTGGVGGHGGAAAPTAFGAPAQPANLGEAALAQWKQAQPAQQVVPGLRGFPRS